MPGPQARQLSPVPVWLGRLKLELRRLATPLLAAGGRGLLSITFDLPLKSSRVPVAGPGPWFHWHRPVEGHRLLGTGVARLLEASGPARFDDMRGLVERQLLQWTHLNQGQARPLARAFLGFAFDPEDPMQGEWAGFPNLGWMVPELMLEWRGGHCTATFSHDRESRLTPEQVLGRWLDQLQRLLEPPPDRSGPVAILSRRARPAPLHWRRQVARAVERMAAGDVLRKVVLSRRLELKLDRTLQIDPLLNRLQAELPQCIALGIGLSASTLVAATPERLLSLADGRVCCDAIAGTVAGETRIDDAAMRCYEHQPVVQAIVESLSPWCRHLAPAPAPASMPLRELSHLVTPVKGELAGNADLFSLLEALHPTPAVGGVPHDLAMEWIRAQESERRGWYTGGFGWMADAERAEMAVVLRCGLVRGRNLSLFAGAGITPVSDPGAELAETDLKFRMLLQRLTQ